MTRTRLVPHATKPRMRRLLAPSGVAAIVVVLLALVAAAPADAQQALPIVTPLVGPPQVSWLAPPRGDATGTPGDATIEPLRVGLLGDVPPTGDPACAQPGAATAENANLAPSYLTTLRLVPRLTLVGFSRGGCPLDGAAGAGIVYMVPIRPNVSLALSGGWVSAPHAGPNGTPLTSRAVRADFVFKQPDGRALSVGLKSGHGATGLVFGGVL